ncbi:8778_t:CDS:10 [Paraglomus occultum]|uniref:8778_t:CDS:1 n=1 Tax=Paraglomus occultum TaxID=144539 RepID=A0A9N9FDN0_9GLOM|nr:8778_t:CDS:10 [Paraglomus occultum]
MSIKTPRDEEECIEENVAKKRKITSSKDNDDIQSSTTQMRLRIGNLPPYTTTKTLKKFLNVLEILDPKISKDPKKNYAFVTFKNNEDLSAAKGKVDQALFKKNCLRATIETFDMKDQQAFYERRAAQRQVELEEDTRLPHEKLADQVTPLYKLPYSEQLVKKQKAITQILHKFRNNMRKLSNVTPEILSVFEARQDKLPCEVLDIIASPVTEGYRTKCEFTIGINIAGEKVVGFLLGRFKQGYTIVEEPTHCLHVSETAKKIAKATQDYVRKSSYDVYDRATKEGHWRLVAVRTQRSGEVMVILQFHPQSLSTEEIDRLKLDIREYFSKASSSYGFSVTSLLIQISSEVADGLSPKASLDLLHGSDHIHEELLDCRFRISPRAFFQVNTACTELLYAKCREWAQLNDSKTLLLDLCCGTGTIGITMANHVEKVVGVEMVPEAVEDAKFNAELNGLKNVDFIAGKVEDNIDVFRRENESVVAIMDPPRAGVHPSVIKAVRSCDALKRVLFVACDAEAAMNNFISLCRPQSNQWAGKPFYPKRAVAVDLFPHTNHCELLIAFERD